MTSPTIHKMEILKKKAKRFLVWTEKYTKTDMTYLTKGSFWLSIGYGIQMLSGLIISIGFANLLPKEAYGTYQFVISASGILGGLTLSGISSAITRQVAQGNDNALRSGFRIYMTWSLGIVLASVAVSLYYFINDNSLLGTSFLIVGALVPFYEGFRLHIPFLVGKERFRESVVLAIWRKPIPIIALLTTLYFSNDPLLLIFVYFASHALSGGLVYWHIVRYYNLPPSREKTLLGYSKHLSLMAIVVRISTYIDKILVFHFLGAVPVAIYSIAQLPTHYLKNGLISIVRSLVISKLSKRTFGLIKSTLPRKILLLGLPSVLVVAIYIIITPLVFGVIFPEYPESVLLSQVLALSILFIPRVLMAQSFVAHEKTRELYIERISAPILKILSLLVFLPIFGVWGIVYAILLAEFVSTVITYIVFLRTSDD